MAILNRTMATGCGHQALKQNLKIKTFVGTSANALKIQICMALIAMLLLTFRVLQSCICCLDRSVLACPVGIDKSKDLFENRTPDGHNDIFDLP